MKLNDCSIGTEFGTAEGRRWRVTDVGGRTVSAIVIDLPDGPPIDPVWLQGPPYMVEEKLFDERALDVAFMSFDDAVHASMAERHHPGFPHAVVSTMMRALYSKDASKVARPPYPFPNLLRIDRWDATTQDVLHPFATVLDETSTTWTVRLYRLFAQTFTEQSDTALVHLPVAQPEHFHAARRAHPATPI